MKPSVTAAGAGNPTFYGIRFGMEFLQDGAVLVNRTLGEIATRPPGVDTVEEVKVETMFVTPSMVMFFELLRPPRM